MFQAIDVDYDPYILCLWLIFKEAVFLTKDFVWGVFSCLHWGWLALKDGKKKNIAVVKGDDCGHC